MESYFKRDTERIKEKFQKSRIIKYKKIVNKGGNIKKMADLRLFKGLHYIVSHACIKSDYTESFVYNGFKDASSNMSLGNAADITSTGLLRLTNDFDGTYQMSFVYYSHPIRFKNNNTGGGSVFSFSTSFIFSILPESPGLRGLGIAFIIAPQAELPGEKGSDLPGLFDQRTDTQPTNFVLAIELDTIHNREYDIIQGDHVGIDFNDLTSVISKPSGYYTENNGSSFRNLSLVSGVPIRVWIEYDEVSKNLTVTLAPLTVPKPATPLLSYNHDLSDLLLDSMYVGFSSATSFAQTSHYILGWSFVINNGTDLPIDISQLPKPPAKAQKSKRAAAKFLGVELQIIIPVLALTFIIGILFVLAIIRNCKMADDVVEDWELNYERLRFSFKHLYIATNGFKEKNLLGNGGFGKVYNGVLPASKVNVAVKRISHNSKQGVREFISEIISIGHLRHRNLAHLLGYCRRHGELLLVYDYMANGSLDKLLFHKYDSAAAPTTILDWNQRFQIIKGVACALVYLHEDWEQVVVHRDIKDSNVLLDGEMNARLGDFGLARLYDRGTNPKTTNVAGTLGYMAPELIRTGKATTSSDVFAFGALLLEVACGRRPIELNVPENEESEILVDWVLNCWRSGAILQTSDPVLGNEYIKEEMESVLKLGLLCSQNDAKARPSMRQAMQYLEGELPCLKRNCGHFIIPTRQ
ncbi:L-type lectin-domain containing receptor kinase IV.1-like [Papaver somniferum]|uniref:L-type lectin-domain containing receptor kinase IV.1-like n=1 Tax=Papaver somniferum TaxID=3469 RepID=UPI000E6F9B7B|nr:L-type lectin-domain containing receptor kinase IV.1-like [Papaver somniferum]